jgi:septal ring factor EnvC (AmiA/AmiB activator)
MKFLANNLKFIVSALVIGSLMVGCTSHPDEEQIKTLEETKSAALSAEKTLADKKKERADLEKQVEAKKAELAKVKAEKERVQQKLQARQGEMNN